MIDSQITNIQSQYGKLASKLNVEDGFELNGIFKNSELEVENSSTFQLKNIKGKGLMLGIEFDFEVGDLRKQLIYDYQIFTGGAMNKNLLRIFQASLSKELSYSTFLWLASKI